MATNDLLDKLRGYLNLDRQKQKKNKDEIRALLKKLKKRERALEEKLKKASDAKARKRIKRDLKVLYTQRKKGVKLHQSIRCKKQAGKC
jgi:hypothetical protein